MKVRSLKQALHWLFLILGMVSLIALAFSTVTYLDYVREGYGLEVSVTEIWITGNNLAVRVDVKNPGGLYLDLNGTVSIRGCQSSEEFSQGTFNPVRVKPDNETYFVIYIQIGQAILEDLLLNGMADITLNLDVNVPERHTQTKLDAEFRGVEVRR